MEAVAGHARHLRSGHLLHRRHPRPSAGQVLAQVLRPDWPRNWRGWARISWPSRTWPGCAGRSPRASWSRRSRKRSASPSTSTRTTPAASTPASVLQAGDAGVDVVDLAIASMCGSTSQPNLNSIVAALQHTPRDTGLDLARSERILRLLGERARVLRAVRRRAEDRQRRSLSARNARRPVHQPQGAGRQHGPGAPLAGDRPHSTPRSTSSSATSSRSPPPPRWSATWPCSSSPAASGPRTWSTSSPGSRLSRRVSSTCSTAVWAGRPGAGRNRSGESCSGRKGFRRPGSVTGPPWPKAIAAAGAGQPGADLEKLRAELSAKLKRPASDDDLYSHLMYPQVFAAFDKHRQTYSDVSVLPTPA